MKSTAYEHRTKVDRIAGTYRYDCVGFVSYCLKFMTPEAWKSIRKTECIAKGRIPSPRHYREFFEKLAFSTQPGWSRVSKASELRPGDIVAWEHQTEKATGHSVIIASIPLQLPNGEWLCDVYDSTSSPHAQDSRPEDPRAEILHSTGRRGGLGHGKMIFLSDQATGILTGVRWKPQSMPLMLPIAAGRPAY
jgi:hypothetical protein